MAKVPDFKSALFVRALLAPPRCQAGRVERIFHFMLIQHLCFTLGSESDAFVLNSADGRPANFDEDHSSRMTVIPSSSSAEANYGDVNL